MTAFSKAVGEYETLSRVDLHLLALAHTMETAAHGEIHLRQSPPRPRVAAKPHSGQVQIPGWGSQGADWAELDALNEAEASTPQAAGTAVPTS